nr:MAG TPA: hypothetical protein [Bacteriophage sp.]
MIFHKLAIDFLFILSIASTIFLCYNYASGGIGPLFIGGVK